MRLERESPFSNPPGSDYLHDYLAGLATDGSCSPLVALVVLPTVISMILRCCV